jgi:hypothetical protein
MIPPSKVEADAHPAVVADVRRDEETRGVAGDENVLSARRRLAPERDLVAVVGAVEHDEDLVPHAPGRVSVSTEWLLRRFRQRKADLAQALQGDAGRH